MNTQTHLNGEINQMKELVDLLANGYSIGEMNISKHNENTRFVIIEKYPEKETWNESEYGITEQTLYVNVEIIKPVNFIETKFIINQDGTVEYGV